MTFRQKCGIIVERIETDKEKEPLGAPEGFCEEPFRFLKKSGGLLYYLYELAPCPKCSKNLWKRDVLHEMRSRGQNRSLRFACVYCGLDHFSSKIQIQED